MARLADARQTAFGEEPGQRKIVPLSIDLDGERSALVVSGPNAGGKTVALQIADDNADGLRRVCSATRARSALWKKWVLKRDQFTIVRRRQQGEGEKGEMLVPFGGASFSLSLFPASRGSA